MVERYKPPKGKPEIKGKVIPYPGKRVEPETITATATEVETPKRRRVGERGKQLAPFSEKVKLARLCQAYVPRAFSKLTGLLEAEKTSQAVQLRCIELIFERAFGRTPQGERDMPQAGGMLVTPEQLMRMSRDELNQLEHLLAKLCGVASDTQASASSQAMEDKRRIAAEFEGTLN